VEVIFLRGAEADLLAAWMRYEEILPGLGDRFEAEVRAALLRTVELPESAPVYAGEFRRLLVRKFDHGIFYRNHGCARPPPRPNDDQAAVKPLS
jgi:hypothetical protein